MLFGALPAALLDPNRDLLSVDDVVERKRLFRVKV